MQTQIIVNESCSTIRYLARQALRDRWVMASVAVLIYSACVEVPPIFIDAIFGATSGTANLMTSQLDGSMPDLLTYTMETSGYTSGSVFSSIYTLLVTGPFAFGISLFFISFVRKGPNDYGQIFSGFSYYGRTLGLSVLLALITFAFLLPSIILIALGFTVGSLILIFLGVLAIALVIIPSLMFSMCFYLMVDNVEIGVIGALGMSRNLMRGNMGKFFLLNLSFIGWFIVGGLILSVVISLFSIGGSSFLIAVGGFIGQAGIFVVMAYLFCAEVQFYDLLTGRLRLGNPNNLSGGY